jgi:hypothetical protein
MSMDVRIDVLLHLVIDEDVGLFSNLNCQLL